MDWTEIIATASAFILGGGLSSLATIKYTKATAKSNSESAHMDTVNKIIKEYQDLLDELKESYNSREKLIKDRIDILETKITEQQKTIKESALIITKLKTELESYNSTVIELTNKINALRELSANNCNKCMYVDVCTKRIELNK